MQQPVDNTPFVLTAATVRTIVGVIVSFGLATLVFYQKQDAHNWADALVAGGIAALTTLAPFVTFGGYDVFRASKGAVEKSDVGAFAPALDREARDT